MAESEPKENGREEPAPTSSELPAQPDPADPGDTAEPPPENGEPSESSEPSDAAEPAEAAEPPDGPSPSDSSTPSDPSDQSDSSDASDASDEADQPIDLSRSSLVQPAATEQLEPEPSTDQEPSEESDEKPDKEPEEATAAASEQSPDSVALRRTVEALLFAAEAPLTVREIARAASSKSNIVRKVLANLQEALDIEGRPWELLEVAGGWRYVTRAEYFPAVQKLKVQRSQRRLTPAAMEVLALIAYSQEPIGRAEIEAVRGVDSGPVLRMLLERKLVRIAGRGEGLGQPLLYAVSQEFLEHFGLKSTKDLPQPGEFKG